LAEETFLSDEFIRQLTAVGEVDILVGVPTSNNRNTIERVVSAIQVGLTKYFPRERIALVNADAASRDNTAEVFRNASIQDFRTLLTASPLRTTHRISTSYRALQGKGAALRIILAAADLLRAKACALVSADLQSITPEWIESLIRPVYKENFDLVTPIYHRHKFDGLLIKNIVSPMIRAVYGQKIREPLGGEFAFSGRLACHYLAQDIWHDDMVRQGAEIWMTTSAIVGGYRLGQSFLGPKIHATRQSQRDLVGTIQQVVGSLFRSLENHESYWQTRQGSQAVPIFGFEYSLALEPIRVNRKAMLQKFRNGVDQLSSILELILSAETLGQIREAARLSDREFRFSNELWVKTVYEFASSYHRSVINRDHLLQSLTPLYHGRIGSFVLEDSGATAEQVENKLEELGLEYERLKPHLLERWTHGM
jgi:glycosyltransferase involved in cell wall biosynthesis